MDMERRMDRVERRLDATLKIVQTGMKMLVKMEKENAEFRKETREFKKETREAIHALIDSQMRTDAQLAGLTATVTDLGEQVKALGIKIDRFVDGLGTGGNGSGGGRR
jgi:hypothetical protein